MAADSAKLAQCARTKLIKSVAPRTLPKSAHIGPVGIGMAAFNVSETIHAPAEAVWAALADIGSIHVWNPGVKDSHSIGDRDTGHGASRHCDLDGDRYLEEQVVEYDPGTRLTMRITESNLPFARADVQFVLEPKESSTRVTVRPDYTLKYGPVGVVMDRVFVERTYMKGMKAPLRGLKEHVESALRAA
jgi:uncharacterized protein YndB with AHSA1/START domain